MNMTKPIPPIDGAQRPVPARSGLKAPFPWFGGKSRAAALVWPRFGDVPNYVEPFFGSGAILLKRPHAGRIETVNDLDCYVSNFWRAVAADPEAVAWHADWPVNEADLHARHLWLVNQGEFRERMKCEPEFFDARIAGWWVWGISCWIGGGWCAIKGSKRDRADGSRQRTRPQLMTENGIHSGRGNGSRAPRGIHCLEADQIIKTDQKRPVVDGKHPGKGVHSLNGYHQQVTNKRPLLTQHGGGGGVHAPGMSGYRTHQKIPYLKSELKGGVNHKLPMIGGGSGASGNGIHIGRGGHLAAIMAWIFQLRDRLRGVRVCCGDWQRILGPSPTTCIGVTAVFLDPPYSDAAGRAGNLYSVDSLTVAHAVREWAIAHGQDAKLRIALCGYEGEHVMPADWECVAWKAGGGYGNQASKKNQNAKKERIWFSPACLRPEENPELF